MFLLFLNIFFRISLKQKAFITDLLAYINNPTTSLIPGSISERNRYRDICEYFWNLPSSQHTTISVGQNNNNNTTPTTGILGNKRKSEVLDSSTSPSTNDKNLVMKSGHSNRLNSSITNHNNDDNPTTQMTGNPNIDTTGTEGYHQSGDTNRTDSPHKRIRIFGTPNQDRALKDLK